MKNVIAILKQNPKFFGYGLLALGIILIAVMAPCWHHMIHIRQSLPMRFKSPQQNI
ncbi:hypothetical protein Q5O14_16595 [Eubacteriaceae bacterium ES2]|nr:hypothetical protein Q5O14_16595 [Eubacteriaceae bacterium ES2]